MCRESRYEEAIDELKKAKLHAFEMVQYGKRKDYHFTAPLFDRVSGKKPPTDSQTTDLDDLGKALDNNVFFDPIRHTEAFQAFI